MTVDRELIATRVPTIVVADSWPDLTRVKQLFYTVV